MIGEPLAQLPAAWWGFRMLRCHGLDSRVLRQIAERYWRYVAATVLTGLLATVLFALSAPGAGWSIGATFTSGLGHYLVVGLIMVPLYILFTWIFGVHEVRYVVATESCKPRTKRRRR